MTMNDVAAIVNKTTDQHDSTEIALKYLREMKESYIERRAFEIYPLPEWYVLDEAIKAIIFLRDIPRLKEIPKDYSYDTETDKFEVYRNRYTGNEIHILKEPQLYRYDKPMIPVKEIKNLIEEYTDSQRRADYFSKVGEEEGRDFAEGQSAVYEEVIEDLKELIKEGEAR